MKSISELEQFLHERSMRLRSPLVSVLGLVRLIRYTPDESEKMKYLDLIEKRILMLDEYIQEYNDFFRNNLLDINLQSFSIKSLVNQIMDDFRCNFHKQIDFRVTGKVDEIVSDPLVVKVILHKLIRNAIKYQKIKEENKMVKVILEEDDKVYIITVEDNGTGMFQEEVDDLVNMFSSAKKRSNRSLFMVKESLKKINGTCSIESKLGSGTRFIIKLPKNIS